MYEVFIQNIKFIKLNFSLQKLRSKKTLLFEVIEFTFEVINTYISLWKEFNNFSHKANTSYESYDQWFFLATNKIKVFLLVIISPEVINQIVWD